MNSSDTTKLKELMNNAGFLPDGDLLEFGEIVVNECLKIVIQSASVPNKSEYAKAEATRIYEKITDKFGIKYLELT